MAQAKKAAKAEVVKTDAPKVEAPAADGQGVSPATLVDLQKLISNRQSELKKLQKRREKLMVQVKEVDAEISKITGGGIVGRGRRGNNDKPLRVYIEEQLLKNKKGLTLAELAQNILDTGFKTSSANFRNVLYQSLYNSTSIKHDQQSGKYIIVK